MADVRDHGAVVQQISMGTFGRLGPNGRALLTDAELCSHQVLCSLQVAQQKGEHAGTSYLEGDGLGPPLDSRAGEQHAGLGVLHPARQGFCREARKHNAVHRPNACAGQLQAQEAAVSM